MKKRILCFGDSNTWGYMVSGGRFDEDVRWPMKLQELLGDDYRIIEEGFNGRTCDIHTSALQGCPNIVLCVYPESEILQMAQERGVTEELKAGDQMLWVQLMNNLKQAAEETVLAEVVYS